MRCKILSLESRMLLPAPDARGFSTVASVPTYLVQDAADPQAIPIEVPAGLLASVLPASHDGKAASVAGIEFDLVATPLGPPAA